MNHYVRILILVLASAFVSANSLSGATFTYLDGADGNVEIYTSAANMAAGTQSETGSYTGFGNLSDFRSLAFDGTTYYATHSSNLITYTSTANIRSNTQASNVAMQFNQNSTHGLATSDGSLFWLIFESSTLIPYSSAANLASNTQGLSGQGNTNDNITTTWDTSVVRGFGFDGNDYYVVRDVTGTDNDILTVHDTIAAVGTDTRLSTTTIDAGAGGTVPALLSGAGLAVTPVPEPTTYGLISGFLLLTTAYLRRRNRK